MAIKIIKKFYEKMKVKVSGLTKTKEKPSEIALGFALAALIAILPTFGLGVFIGLGLAVIFKKISKIAMLVSFAVFNPLVLIGIYGASYSLGKIILKGTPITFYRFELLNKLFVYPRRFLVGNLILAVTISFACYFIVFFSVRYYQNKHPFEKIVAVAEKFEEKLKEQMPVIKAG